MIKMLSVDPGGTTGWALFHHTKIMSFGTVPTTEKDRLQFLEWVDTIECDIIVCENYIIRPPKSGGFDHSWDTGWTLRAIGALMFKAHQLNAKFVLQNASIKTAASPMVSGKPYVKKQGNHIEDAMLHGYYYLLKELKMSRKELGIDGSETKPV